jgi:cell division septal protein FtsQ
MTKDDDNNTHADDEVSVTEVSAEVLEELSHLFGEPQSNAATGEKNSVEEIDETIDGSSLGAQGITTAIAKDVTPMAEVISIIAEPGLEPDLTPAPPDPLLNPVSRGGDVMEAADDSGGTVVIVDDEMDRVVIVDEDRPDPRFEERQRRHKRRERLRKVKWFKLALAISIAVALVLGVLASPLFAIRKVVFEGNVYTSPKTIEDVTKLLDGASVFTADTRAAREKVLEDPWVSEVRITTDFPGSALVEVAERVPVVWYVGEDQKARMIDARGFIIAVLEGWPTKYLQVTGTGASLEAGSFADDVYRAAAQLVLALPEEIRGRVKSLELAGGGELSMILKEGTIVRFGPPTDLQNKLVAVVVLFRRQDPATLVVVDVSTGNPTVQVK